MNTRLVNKQHRGGRYSVVAMDTIRKTILESVSLRPPPEHQTVVGGGPDAPKPSPVAETLSPARSSRHPMAHKRILDEVYDQLPAIPDDQQTVLFTYPWNPTGERYIRQWNRHYNGLGQPFTLPTFLIKPI